MTQLSSSATNITSGGYSISAIHHPQGVLASIDPLGSITVDTSVVDIAKMRITMNDRPLLQSPGFGKCRDVFVTQFRLDGNTKMHFHALVWEKVFENQESEYGSIFRPNDGIYLAFGSAECRNEFERWVFDYRNTFFRDQELRDRALPSPHQGRMSGSFVPDRHRLEYYPVGICSVRADDFKDWIWIVANCHHPVYRMGTGWFFEKDSEALYFKMRGD